MSDTASASGTNVKKVSGMREARLAPSKDERLVRDLLAKAGIEVNGREAWDIKVHNPEFFTRVLAHGSLALGESYMDGAWDCDRLDQFFHRLLAADLDQGPRLTPHLAWSLLRARFFNRQNKRWVWRAADVHYDLGVDIFEATFDDRLTGSCAYWPMANDLDQAQENKLDLVCRKIGLKENEHVYDIGCGWGAFLGYSHQHYGSTGVGVTISKEQAGYARKRYAGLPLEFLVSDYRDFTGKADHVVSMGMFEHVGSSNYRTYFECARRALRNNGFFLLHTIINKRRFRTIDPWLDKYIFPNGELPTVGQIGAAVEGLFVIEDVHNFGADYDRTLMAWHAKFAGNRSTISERYGEKFCRMWEYYLLSCAAGFRSRRISVAQFVLSPNGVSGGYSTVR